MPSPFFTHRENLFNNYVDHRVRITIRNRRKREKVFVGTFKAFDYNINVLLANVYRVILNHTEEQRQDIEGLLFIRGVHIRSITFEESERNLPKWPTKPKIVRKKKTKSTKTPARSQKEPPEEQPTTPSKPVKLKRRWLTSASPADNSQPPRCQMTPDTSKTAENTEKGDMRFTVKEEVGEVGATTFETFLDNCEKFENCKIKDEPEESSGNESKAVSHE